MKKLILLAFGLCLAGTAAAQQQTLKEAERMLKVEVPDHGKIAQILKGAMTDPSTANDVKTWYLAGKNGFQTYTTGYEQFQQGNQPDKVNMSRALLDGFTYFMRALPLDTIVDAKGKVKTKYSKDIIKLIAANSSSFHDAGVFLYEANDLGGAYTAWDIYTSLPTMTQLGKLAPKADNDSTLGATYYNMGIFAYQAKMKEEAMGAFLKAARVGHGEVAYDNALAMATELQDRDMIQTIANEAFAKYGKQSYIAELVNLYIRDKEYDNALAMINKAIAGDPSNAILYNVKGVLIENQVNDENIAPEVAAKANAEALELYKKATELNPDNAEAHYNYGRMLANKGYKISDDAYELSAKEFNELNQREITPLFQQAAQELEKAIAIDVENNRQALKILKNLYYNLKDDKNMHRIEEIELQ